MKLMLLKDWPPDPQPMRSNRVTNLDKTANDFLNSNSNVSLSAKDNAGLGYARALSVTKELRRCRAV